MVYLKDEQHYNDLYDLFTIKSCLRVVYFLRDAYSKKTKEKNINHKDLFKASSLGLNYELYIETTTRYRDKEKTIKTWVDRDRNLQTMYETATAPTNIKCSVCSSKMFAQDKELIDYLDTAPRVLFFFECPSCQKRKGVYENGEERISKPQLCDKCSHQLEVTYTKKKRILIRLAKCSACGFEEKETDDFDKWEKEREKEKKENALLLKKYRTEFCLTDEEGKKNIEGLDNLKRLSSLLDKWKKEQENPNYQKAMQLKKLSILEIENLLSKRLEKENYKNLNLDKPTIGRDVIVPFTVQEANNSRKEYDSRIALQRIIKSVLSGTNWKLMSEGVTYRLGYLSGRLRGLETKEDLIKIVSENKEDFIY
jgi:hypothetical protein